MFGMFVLALVINLKYRFQVLFTKKVTFTLLFIDKMLPLAESQKLSFRLLLSTILIHHTAILRKEGNPSSSTPSLHWK